MLGFLVYSVVVNRIRSYFAMPCESPWLIILKPVMSCVKNLSKASMSNEIRSKTNVIDFMFSKNIIIFLKVCKAHYLV